MYFLEIVESDFKDNSLTAVFLYVRRNVSSVRHCAPSGYPSLMGFSFAWSVPENTVVSESTLGKSLVVNYSKILHIFLFFSFVRSVTMDKWKDSELERMKVWFFQGFLLLY